jgi:PhnB protein
MSSEEDRRMVHYKPEGFTAVTPYLVVPDVDAQLAFMAKAFGAAENMKMTMPDGKAGHAEVTMYGAKVMMGRGGPLCAPLTAMLYVYVPDVDAVFAAAVAAGGTVEMPLADQFYGDRNGTVRDPNGNQWSIGTRKEILTPEEIGKRMMAMPKAYPATDVKD